MTPPPNHAPTAKAITAPPATSGTAEPIVPDHRADRREQDHKTDQECHWTRDATGHVSSPTCSTGPP